MYTMTCEEVLGKSLGQHVCNLVFSSNGKDLDEAISNMLTEVVVADIDMLGTRPKLWEPGKFKGT